MSCTPNPQQTECHSENVYRVSYWMQHGNVSHSKFANRLFRFVIHDTTWSSQKSAKECCFNDLCVWTSLCSPMFGHEVHWMNPRSIQFINLPTRLPVGCWWWKFELISFAEFEYLARCSNVWLITQAGISNSERFSNIRLMVKRPFCLPATLHCSSK